MGAESHGKRRREGPTPTERWMNLARAVPEILLTFATTQSERILARVDSTRGRLLRGARAADLLLADDPSPSLASWASDALPRLTAPHAASGRFLALCARRARRDGLLRGEDAEALWRAWDARHAEAERRAGEVAARMRAAAADLVEAVRILRVVSRRPPESPTSAAWASKGQRLVRQARAELVAARGAVLQMRRAVFLEFFDAWAVLISWEPRADWSKEQIR